MEICVRCSVLLTENADLFSVFAQIMKIYKISNKRWFDYSSFEWF